MKHMLIPTLIALALIANPSEAKRKRTSEESGGWAYFGPYVGMFNYTDFNSYLSSHEFEQLGNNTFMFGGGGVGQYGRAIVGGYGFGGGQTVASGNDAMDISYGGGFFELGYLPLSLKHLKLGAVLGLGSTGFTIRRYSTTEIEPFDSLLVHGVNHWEITNSAFALAPALLVQVPINWIGIALKGGYLYSPSDNNWRLDDRPLGAPKPALRSSGPFLSLQVTLGGSSGGSKVKVNVKGESKPKDEKKEEEEE